MYVCPACPIVLTHFFLHAFWIMKTQQTPPAPTNVAPENQTLKVSRPRRTRSMRRGTAEISTTSIPDPHFQKDTIDNTQSSLEKDFNSLCQLLQVMNIIKTPNAYILTLYKFKYYGAWKIGGGDHDLLRVRFACKNITF